MTESKTNKGYALSFGYLNILGKDNLMTKHFV